MKNTKLVNLIVIFLAIAVVAMQFVLPMIMGDFQGSDDQAVGLIAEIDPSYKPWADHFWEPSGAFGETLLFALQTSLGLGVIVLYFFKRNSVKKG